MQPCPNCQVGRMFIRKIPYVQWYDADHIVVDRIPAIICDNCGEKSYDTQAIDHLHRLIWSHPDDLATPLSRVR